MVQNQLQMYYGSIHTLRVDLSNISEIWQFVIYSWPFMLHSIHLVLEVSARILHEFCCIKVNRKTCSFFIFSFSFKCECYTLLMEIFSVRILKVWYLLVGIMYGYLTQQTFSWAIVSTSMFFTNAQETWISFYYRLNI